jgi:hypothetical protein
VTEEGDQDQKAAIATNHARGVQKEKAEKIVAVLIQEAFVVAHDQLKEVQKSFKLRRGRERHKKVET